jgi:NTE family protein
MTSGALRPGFPAIETEAEHYWDGGLVSNTPLQWAVESEHVERTRRFSMRATLKTNRDRR